jgi:hypothetical protein
MQSRYRPYGDADTKKSELQRRMESMVNSCNGIAQKSKNRSKGTQNDQQVPGEIFSRTEPVRSSPSASASYQSSLADSSAVVLRKPPVDPLQNCYGRSATSKVAKPNGPDETVRGILSKPSTPKPSTPKRVTFNLDANNSEPLSQNSMNAMSNAPTSSQLGDQSDTVGTDTTLPDVSGKRPGKGPKQSLFQQQQPSKPTRPTLSEQLSAIANKAGDLTADIKAKAGIPTPSGVSGAGSGEVPVYSSPVKNFTVGTLQCRYASSAVFYRNRLEYLFHHPFENSEILLILYYKDMLSLALSPNPQPGKMYFRVPRRLVHFATDYDPNKHFVVVYFSSSLTLQTVRSDVLPLIAGEDGSRGGGRGGGVPAAAGLVTTGGPSLGTGIGGTTAVNGFSQIGRSNGGGR